MKAIVTKQNPDGSYDEVGMNNRTVFEAKTYQGLKTKARKWTDRPFRMEIFRDNNIQQECKEVSFYSNNG